MAIQDVVINIRANVDDVQRKIQSLQRINSLLAQKMGADFAKGFTVLEDKLNKVQFKQIKIKTDTGAFKQVEQQIQTFDKTVQLSNGKLYKFSETFSVVGNKSKFLSASLNEVASAQSKLIGASSKLTTNFSNLSSVNQSFGTQLKGFGDASKFVGTTLNQVTDSGSKITKVFETANGKFVQLTETTTRLPNGIQQVDRSVKELSKTQAQNINTLEKSSKATKGFGQNITDLAKRALLTIPVWFAIRRSISAVFRTIKDGLKDLISFDRALQKARRNLQGSADIIERNFGRLRQEVTKLSVETGKSVEDITNAFQKFATVGFDFETSLAGANSATKLSILLFGDAEETANAFARSMRVLVDESENALPPSQQLSNVMALTAELWKTNAFELNELTQSLEKFAPVAKTAGFTAEETVKILAGLSTAGLRGSRAGRLLRTSLARLVTSTDKLASSLGVKVNPEVDRTFDVFLKTLDALAKARNEAGKVAPEFEKVVKSIFGLRSSDAIKGLIALRSNLQQVLGVTGDVSKFNAEFEKVNETVFQLAERFHNLNREIGKAFVTGLINGDNFKDTLKKINATQNDILKDAKEYGDVLRGLGSLIGKLELVPLNIFSKTKGTSVVRLNNYLSKAFETINQKGQDEFENLVKGINGQLSRIELERLIAEVKTKIKLSERNTDIDPSGVLPQVLNVLEKTFEDLPPLEPEVKLKLGKVDLSEEQQSTIIEALIQNQLERLKIEGALESQVLKIEDALRKEYDVNYDIVDQKKQQLKIEQEISKEQKDRLTFGDEAVKLAEIAKNEGIQTAQAISEVLQGQRDYNTFLRQGGKRAEILKENFEDFVKNKELENFFKGVRTPGQDFVRGGERILIDELPQRDFTPIRAKTEFELSKIQIGLIDSTNTQTEATNKNTASIDELVQLYKSGIKLEGEDAQRLSNALTNENVAQNYNSRANLQNLAQQSLKLTSGGQKDTVDLNIVIDGEVKNFEATPNNIKSIVDAVQKPLTDALTNKLNNNKNDPYTQAVRNRIVEE